MVNGEEKGGERGSVMWDTRDLRRRKVGGGSVMEVSHGDFSRVSSFGRLRSPCATQPRTGQHSLAGAEARPSILRRAGSTAYQARRFVKRGSQAVVECVGQALLVAKRNAPMTDELSLATAFIPHLRTQFSRGSVVLFTGAGFSFDAVNARGERLPTVKELTRRLWEICYGSDTFDESTQLQDAYDAALQSDRTATERLMTSRLSVDIRSAPDYYRELLSMPWLRIYTLNVDDLAEKILEDHRAGRPIRSVSATSDQVADTHRTRTWQSCI